MKCYIHAQQGEDLEAVAICIVCGMGVCMEHAIREDVEVWEGGYPLPSKRQEKLLPKILCPECYAALSG